MDEYASPEEAGKYRVPEKVIIQRSSCGGTTGIVEDSQGPSENEDSNG